MLIGSDRLQRVSRRLQQVVEIGKRRRVTTSFLRSWYRTRNTRNRRKVLDNREDKHLNARPCPRTSTGSQRLHSIKRWSIATRRANVSFTLHRSTAPGAVTYETIIFPGFSRSLNRENLTIFAHTIPRAKSRDREFLAQRVNVANLTVKL